MHDCKHAKEEIIEIALRGWVPGPDELSNCPRCREELASLRGAMQLTDDAMQLVQPREDFWPGYHARLRQRLETQSELTMTSSPQSAPATIWRLLTVSVPVPAPLAFAAFAFIIFAVAFMWHARALHAAPSVLPESVVTRTVEVPLVQERVVTRVVYRDRRVTAPQLAQKLRSPQREDSSQVAEGLAGFTPAHEPKLTIIKASYRDEE